MRLRQHNTPPQSELAALKRRCDELHNKNKELHSENLHLRNSIRYHIRVSVDRGNRIDQLRDILYEDVRPLVAALLSGEKLKKSAVRKLADFFGMPKDPTP